jgi:6-phosphogluconolactonase (cycloisomerase 2 family)
MSEVVGQQNHSRDWDGTLGAHRVNAATGKLTRTGTYATEKQPRGFNRVEIVSYDGSND